MKEGRAVRYFEDLQVGERIELGSVTVTEEEIIVFAKQYDPQPGPETFILGIGATGT